MFQETLIYLVLVAVSTPLARNEGQGRMTSPIILIFMAVSQFLRQQQQQQ